MLCFEVLSVCSRAATHVFMQLKIREDARNLNVVLYTIISSELMLTIHLVKQIIICAGNGKVKTKEPLDMANKAIAQLQEVVDIASKLE